jgi:hypothetical protein
MGRKFKKSDDMIDRLVNAETTLDKLTEAMSGIEWDGQVGNKVADILHAAGWKIEAPDPARLPPACCPSCGKRDELYVHETGVVSFEYDAQRHTANTDTEATEQTNEDYTGYCAACKHHGTLESFSMKLLDWTNEADLEAAEVDDE